MTMMRIALAKAHALPSTIDERRAKIRKASLAVVLKTADATPCVIPYPFRAAQIFIGHCARGRAEIFRRFAGVRHTTLCFFSRLRRNRRALIDLVFLSHRFPASYYCLNFR